MQSTLANIVSHRELLREFVLTELRASTAGTKLGWLWWLLDPLIEMLVYWIFFVGILGRGQVEYAPYPIFLLVGIVCWKHFTDSASAATNMLRTREPLIRSVAFPTIVLPLSKVASNFAFFLFGLVVVLGASILFRSERHSGNLLALLQIVPLMGLQVVVVVGFSLALASLGAMLRDLGMFINYVIRAAFFLSPILYGVDMIERRLSNHFEAPYAELLLWLYMLNPFAILITGYRASIFYGEFLESRWWILLLVETAAVLVIGFRIFRRFDRRLLKSL